MINQAEGIGGSRFRDGAELGELAGGTGALTPAPQAHSVVPEGALALMMPWLSPLSHVRNAVHSDTEQAYA